MKKAISFLLICSYITFALLACSNKIKYDYPFVDITWTRAGDGDTEYIRFSTNGEFSYYCACGNPVNDSDLCTGYFYNDKTKKITLNYSELTQDAIKNITIIKCTKTELVLDFDGDIRKFEIDKETEFFETITYNGNEYLLIEFPNDIFSYDIVTDIEHNEGTVYEIPSDKWSVLYFNGDLFALESEIQEISAFIEADDNYKWLVNIEYANEDNIIEKTIDLSDDELSFIYSLQDAPRVQTVLFDEIEIFGTLCKTSNDGLIIAKTDLLYYAGNWYWRTDEVDESADGWPEYVVLLSESINIKLKLNQ